MLMEARAMGRNCYVLLPDLLFRAPAQITQYTMGTKLVWAYRASFFLALPCLALPCLELELGALTDHNKTAESCFLVGVFQ